MPCSFWGPRVASSSGPFMRFPDIEQSPDPVAYKHTVVANLDAVWRKAFHGFDVQPVNLNRQHQTGTGELAVNAQGTRATNTMFASNMGTRRAKLVTQEICQQCARFGVTTDSFAIQAQFDQLRLPRKHTD